MTDRYLAASREREHALAGLDPAIRLRVERAALELFSEREFHRVRLINIAREGRISLQTLYKYYGSKEAVLFASLDAWLDRLAQRMLDHLQGIENFQDRLRKVFWVLLEYFERNPKAARIILSSLYRNVWRADDTFRQPALASVFLGVIEEGQSQGALTRAIAAIEIADFIFGVVNRAVATWLQRGGDRPLAAKTPALFAMIWRAIASDEALFDTLRADHCTKERVRAATTG